VLAAGELEGGTLVVTAVTLVVLVELVDVVDRGVEEVLATEADADADVVVVEFRPAE